MNIIETPLAGVALIEPDVFHDPRGYFKETWNQDRYWDIGVSETFVQDNISSSEKGILRGLHFQYPREQGKLVQAVNGAVFDVAVDIRLGSPTFGRWYGADLSEDNHRQLFIPQGFAHGFCVTSESAMIAYKCTDYYNPESEWVLRWDDPDIAIDWPLKAPILSKKDAEGVLLSQIPESHLPRYRK